MQILTDYVSEPVYRRGVLVGERLVPRVCAELGITRFDSIPYEVVDGIEYRVVALAPTSGLSDYEVL